MNSVVVLFYCSFLLILKLLEVDHRIVHGIFEQTQAPATVLGLCYKFFKDCALIARKWLWLLIFMFVFFKIIIMINLFSVGLQPLQNLHISSHDELILQG